MRLRIVRVGSAILLVVAAACVAGYRLWPRMLPPPSFPDPLPWSLDNGQPVVTRPGAALLARVATFDDELYAYLMFEHYRYSGGFGNSEVLLSYDRGGGRLVYPVEVHPSDNLLVAIPLLEQARARGFIENFDWRFVTRQTLAAHRYRSGVFVTAYNLPNRRPLEHMSELELADYLRRFIRFKSATDPRIRRKLEPVPAALTSAGASELAGDILTVADFYSLPLDFFIGIGAMENNFMNVNGDLEHAVWKRRAHPGDIVLKRERRRVLVLNYASGVWQITRETLRYAHNLYLKDSRDYSRLPERLRPDKKLDLDLVRPEVLTTYAGILFRDLLDRFHGNVAEAVGAYNGGPRNPNPNYEAGVRMVATYARRVIEHAAILQGRSAAGISFIGPR